MAAAGRRNNFLILNPVLFMEKMTKWEIRRREDK